MTGGDKIKWIPGAEVRQRSDAGVAWPEDPRVKIISALQDGSLSARGDVSIGWFFAIDRYLLHKENSELLVGVRKINNANIPAKLWRHGSKKDWWFFNDRAFLGIQRSRGWAGRTRIDIRIERIFYRQDQVEALWPSPRAGRVKSGEPGRPSTKRWCELKAKEFLASNPSIASTSELARVLSQEFGREFPGQKTPEFNTVRNIIAPIVRDFKAKQH